MKKITTTILAMLLVTLLFSACAKEEENGSVTEEAPGKIEEITKGTADAIVRKIRTPLDKARATRNLGDKRVEEMDKAMENQ